MKYCRDSYTAIYIFYLDNKSGKTLRQSSLETRRQSRHFTSLFYQFPLIQSVFVKHILFMPHMLSISGNFHETCITPPLVRTPERASIQTILANLWILKIGHCVLLSSGLLNTGRRVLKYFKITQKEILFAWDETVLGEQSVHRHYMPFSLKYGPCLALCF